MATLLTIIFTGSKINFTGSGNTTLATYDWPSYSQLIIFTSSKNIFTTSKNI